ncbi:MAG: NTP transferase domain-containing protein [Actinomycetota bacterium]
MGRVGGPADRHLGSDPSGSTALVPAAGLGLAAGEGRRFGGPKAPAVVDGERLVDRAVRILREGGCDPIAVVLGAWVGEVQGAQIVVNDEWPEGMGSSVRAGLAALDADRVVVTLVDLPGMSAEAIRRFVDSPSRLAQGAFGGERGHPVVIGSEHVDGVVRAARGDRGARDYLREHAAEVSVIEIGDVASGEDLDEPPAPPR